MITNYNKLIQIETDLFQFIDTSIEQDSFDIYNYNCLIDSIVKNGNAKLLKKVFSYPSLTKYFNSYIDSLELYKDTILNMCKFNRLSIFYVFKDLGFFEKYKSIIKATKDTTEGDILSMNDFNNLVLYVISHHNTKFLKVLYQTFNEDIFKKSSLYSSYAFTRCLSADGHSFFQLPHIHLPGTFNKKYDIFIKRRLHMFSFLMNQYQYLDKNKIKQNLPELTEIFKSLFKEQELIEDCYQLFKDNDMIEPIIRYIHNKEEGMFNFIFKYNSQLIYKILQLKKYELIKQVEDDTNYLHDFFVNSLFKKIDSKGLFHVSGHYSKFLYLLPGVDNQSLLYIYDIMKEKQLVEDDVHLPYLVFLKLFIYSNQNNNLQFFNDLPENIQKKSLFYLLNIDREDTQKLTSSFRDTGGYNYRPFATFVSNVIIFISAVNDPNYLKTYKVEEMLKKINNETHSKTFNSAFSIPYVDKDLFLNELVKFTNKHYFLMPEIPLTNFRDMTLNNQFLLSEENINLLKEKIASQQIFNLSYKATHKQSFQTYFDNLMYNSLYNNMIKQLSSKDEINKQVEQLNRCKTIHKSKRKI